MAHNESYTTEEMAKMLKVSKLTVYDLIKKGEINAFRVGRQMRVDAEELERYKKRGREVREASYVRRETESAGTGLRQVVISGQDSSLDILSRHLEAWTDELRPLRSYSGSLESLIAMYEGKADIVSTHLLDGDTLQYNVPYVRKILVSHSFMVINLIERKAGIYTAAHNPKNIVEWKDAARTDIKIVNREQGAGARVLLDEQLRLHGIERYKLNGYENIQTSHLGVAGTIAKGEADMGVGIEQTARVANIGFIPMVTESYDLVMLKTEKNIPLIEHVSSILNSESFKDDLRSLGYGVEKTGKVMYEQ